MSDDTPVVETTKQQAHRLAAAEIAAANLHPHSAGAAVIEMRVLRTLLRAGAKL